MFGQKEFWRVGPHPHALRFAVRRSDGRMANGCKTLPEPKPNGLFIWLLPLAPLSLP